MVGEEGEEERRVVAGKQVTAAGDTNFNTSRLQQNGEMHFAHRKGLPHSNRFRALSSLRRFPRL